MAIVAPGGFFQNLTNHSAQVTRLSTTSLYGKPRTTGSNVATTMSSAGGVVLQSKSFGTNQQVSPNMSALVHRGKAIIEGTDSLTQGNYGVFNDADVTVNFATSDPTRLRVDIVYMQVRDASYAGANNDVRILVSTGNPATGTPDESVLPTNSMVLSYVNIRANTTQVLDTDITDRRRWLIAGGGIRPIKSFEVGDAGIINGDVRYYQSFLQGYDTADGTWRGLNSARVTYTKHGWFGVSQYGPSATSPAQLTTLAVADPGWPYYIDAQFNLSYANDAGTRFDIFLLDNATNGPEICAAQTLQGQTIFAPVTSYRSWYGPLTGARTLYVMAIRAIGSGNLQCDFTDPRGSFLNVALVAAPPSS